jgi:hypothetical protein
VDAADLAQPDCDVPVEEAAVHSALQERPFRPDRNNEALDDLTRSTYPIQTNKPITTDRVTQPRAQLLPIGHTPSSPTGDCPLGDCHDSGDGPWVGAREPVDQRALTSPAGSTIQS